MSRAQLLDIQPVLPSSDVRASIEFYSNKLGFTTAFQDSVEQPCYVGFRRDRVELHVQWHAAAEWERVERPMLRLVVSNVQELFLELKEKSVFHGNTALRETPWGTREFAFFDPHQNGLTFYQDL